MSVRATPPSYALVVTTKLTKTKLSSRPHRTKLYYDAKGNLHDLCWVCLVECCQKDHFIVQERYYRYRLRYRLMVDGFIPEEKGYIKWFNQWVQENKKFIEYCPASWKWDKYYRKWEIKRDLDEKLESATIPTFPVHVPEDIIEVMTTVTEQNGVTTIDRLMKLTPDQMDFYHHVLKGTFLKNRKVMGDQKAWKKARQEAVKAHNRVVRESKKPNSIKQGSTSLW